VRDVCPLDGGRLDTVALKELAETRSASLIGLNMAVISIALRAYSRVLRRADS